MHPQLLIMLGELRTLSQLNRSDIVEIRRRVEQLEKTSSPTATWLKLATIPLLPILALLPAEKLTTVLSVLDGLKSLLAR